MKAWNRHDYAIICRSGRLYAFGQAAESAPQWGTDVLSQLILERSGLLLHPAIITRQNHPEKGMVQVGWSGWIRENGRRLRVAVQVPEESIERCISPYEVFSLENQWPEELYPLLEELKREGERLSVDFGIIGAAGLQILTGRSYLHSASDLDLIVPYDGESDPAEIAAVCRGLGEQYERDLDVELQFAGFGGVKLKEWVSDQRTVLVKGNDFLDIRTREECIGFRGSKQTA